MLHASQESRGMATLYMYLRKYMKKTSKKSSDCNLSGPLGQSLVPASPCSPGPAVGSSKPAAGAFGDLSTSGGSPAAAALAARQPAVGVPWPKRQSGSPSVLLCWRDGKELGWEASSAAGRGRGAPTPAKPWSLWCSLARCH